MNHTRCDPESETAADGTVTETAYDAEDHTIATWGATYPVAFAYDRLGRMVSAFVAGISTNAYTYDPETLALSMETQNGVEIERTTDGLGRDTGFSLGADYAVQYAYDAYGRFHSVTSSVRSMSPRSGKSAKSVAIYSYLPNSDLVAGMTASSGFLWTRAYESGRSLITSVENRFGETVISRYDYENDELGRRTSRADSGLAFAAQPTYGDSATVEMPAYNAYSYNTRSEVTGATRRLGTPDAPGDLVLGQQYAYNFDPIGNRITAAEGDTSRTASYTANSLNQYSQRTVPDEMDLIGTAPTNVAVTVNQNPASRQSAYWHHALEVTNAASAAYPQVAITAVYNPPGTNDPDVVTSQTGRVFVAQTPEAFQYDSDGNLTQDGRFTYSWDAENRLITATTRDDLPVSVPRVRVTHQYDHQSRRISSATAAWTNDDWQATESRAFLYDGWNVVRETINHQPSTTNYYTWGLDLSDSLQGAGGIGGLLSASLDGTAAFYCHDANGNVGQLVSPDGDLLAHYEYSPFGETIVATGPLAKANPFRFSTKWFDNDTGLGYWGYRWYSPGTGRWINRDAIQEKGGYNLYSMVNNDPNNSIDVLGILPGYISLRPPKTKLKCTCANAAMAAWANTTPINYLLWSRWLDNKGGTEWLNYSAFDPLGIWRHAAKAVVENKLQYAEGWAAEVPCNETRVDTASFSMLAGAAPNYMINYWTQTTTYHIFYGKTCDKDGCCQKLWASASISNAAYDETNFDEGKDFPAWPFLISDELINQCFGGGNNDFTIRGIDNDEITKNWDCP